MIIRGYTIGIMSDLVKIAIKGGDNLVGGVYLVLNGLEGFEGKLGI